MLAVRHRLREQLVHLDAILRIGEWLTRGIGESARRNGNVAQRPQPVEQGGIGQLLGCLGASSGRSESPNHSIKLVVTFMSDRLAPLEKVLELTRIDACVIEFRPGRVNKLQAVCLKSPQLAPAKMQQGQIGLEIEF